MGGVNDNDIYDMSGGLQRSFAMSSGRSRKVPR